MLNIPNLAILTVWSAIFNAVCRPALKDFQEGGISTLLENGLGANYIIWFSLLIATQKIWHSSPSFRERENPNIIFYLCPILILQLVPSASLSWIAAAYGGLFIFLNSSGKPIMRLAAILIICASLREPLTALFLKVFSENILNADTLLTSAVLTIMGHGHYFNANIITLESGQPLLILTGCSVFTNLSYSSLLWFALHVTQDRAVTRLSWLFLLAILSLTIATNAVRLAFMSLSKYDYLFYHDGLGADFFEWGIFLLTITLTLIGCYYATSKQNISYSANS